MLWLLILFAGSICYCWSWMILPTINQQRRYTYHNIHHGTSINKPTPPEPFRNETSFVLAGDVPTKDGESAPMRQSASSSYPLLSPPKKIPNPHGWMRDDTRTNETVLNHLHAENEYGEQMTSHLKDLRKEIYEEILSSTQETDYITPSLKTSTSGESYWYYGKWTEGESYLRYYRAPAKEDEIYLPQVNKDWNHKKINSNNNETSLPPLLPSEELYLDVPSMARGKTYFALGSIAVSPDQKYVAYSSDEKGGETCSLYVKNIKSGKVYTLYDEHNTTELLECNGSIYWSEQSDAIFYITFDSAHRPYKLFRRQIFDLNGQWIDNKSVKDELLIEEKDELFNVLISKSFDSRYLIVQSSSKETSECNYLDLRSKDELKSNELVCIAKRQVGVVYRVTHCHGWWLVQSNIETPNMSLKACRVGEEGMDKWNDVVTAYDQTKVFDGSHKRSIDGVTIFSPPPSSSTTISPLAYAVVYGREEGMPRIWILELNEESETITDENTSPLVVSKMTRLQFDEDAYDVG